MNDVMAMSQAVQAVMRTFDKHSLDSLQCLTVMAQIVAVMAAMVLEQDESAKTIEDTREDLLEDFCDLVREIAR